MNLARMTAGIETTTEATSAEHASAMRNRDVLTLLSGDDRARLAGRYAVVLRHGASTGKVIGYGQRREEAVLMAESHPEYQRMSCAVQYVSPFAEHDIGGEAGS